MAVKQNAVSKLAKRGLFVLMTGFALILIGAGLIAAGGTTPVIIGWVLNVVGIFVGLYGYGYFTSSITKKVK